MKRKVKCVWVHFKDSAFAIQFWGCKTLRECLRLYGMKRSDVEKFWFEYKD